VLVHHLPSIVTTGFIPVVHAAGWQASQELDCRDKPGTDDEMEKGA
jgi:hypothetical protein